MSLLTKILLAIIVVLIAVCTFLVLKTKSVQQENATLQAAINKPATEQKPVIKYKIVEKFIPKEVIQEVIQSRDLSDEETAAYLFRIQELENRFCERTTEVTVDGGSTSKPEIPSKLVTQETIKDKRCVVEGMGYSSAAGVAFGYQPLRKLDLYGMLGYHSDSKVGAGLLYRF